MMDMINEDITDIRKGWSRILQLVDSWFPSLDAPIFYWVLCLYQHKRTDSHTVWTTSSAQGLLFDVCRQRDFSGAVWMRWGADVCWLELGKLFQAWEKVWEMVQKYLCDEGMKGNARSVLQDSLRGVGRVTCGTVGKSINCSVLKLYCCKVGLVMQYTWLLW